MALIKKRITFLASLFPPLTTIQAKVHIWLPSLELFFKTFVFSTRAQQQRIRDWSSVGLDQGKNVRLSELGSEEIVKDFSFLSLALSLTCCSSLILSSACRPRTFERIDNVKIEVRIRMHSRIEIERNHGQRVGEKGADKKGGQVVYTMQRQRKGER